MPLRGDINIMEDTFKSSQAQSRYRVVSYSSTQGFVTNVTDRTSTLAGITQNATSASGDTVRLRQLGKSLVTIDAAVTKGIPLFSRGTAGFVSNVGGATGDFTIGVTEEGLPGAAGTSGDQITCFLQIRRV